MLRRIVGVVVALLVSSTALVGLAHTRPGRPLLKYLGFAQPRSCPLGYDGAGGAEAQRAARRRFAHAHRGERSAAARPALGFSLDETRRAEVLAWAARHGVDCARVESTGDLDCVDVPEASVGPVSHGLGAEHAWLSFDDGDRLVAVSVLRRSTDAEVTAGAFSRITDAVGEQAGFPSKIAGEASATTLSKGLLRQVSREYRFDDYYAVARATNLGQSYVLTEDYRSLR